VLLHPPSSRVLCFTPELCTLVRPHSVLSAWPSCPRVFGCPPRVARLARLHALVHYAGAHPRPSRSTLMPLSLSAARPAIPPHMLSSPVPAHILPACCGDLGPCAQQFPTFDYIRPCRPNQSACRCHLVVRAEQSACTSRRPPAPPVRQHRPVCPRVCCSQTARPPAPVRDTS
jgi:hypothetical protein